MSEADGATRSGVRRLPRALSDRVREALVAEAEGVVFTPPHPRAGGWFAAVDVRGPRAVAAAVESLTALAAENDLGFTPNEASFQRYEPTGNGLPPHRDQRYYVDGIAIATLSGEATFAIHSGRGADQLVDEWTTTPGEVVLLPGWQPGRVDPRPWHRVDPPTSRPRLMFQLRRLAVPDTTDWSDEFTETERDQALELAGREPSARRG